MTGLANRSGSGSGSPAKGMVKGKSLAELAQEEFGDKGPPSKQKANANLAKA